MTPLTVASGTVSQTQANVDTLVLKGLQQEIGVATDYLDGVVQTQVSLSPSPTPTLTLLLALVQLNV